MAVHLTYKELELLQNAEVFFLKNSIIQKVYTLFGNITEKFNAITKELTNIPPQAFTQSPKISKGENYIGLPWVMLDYYRAFNQENSFAIRCFFWWGNSFSFHVYATGDLQNIAHQNLPKLTSHWYGCIKDSPWLHEFTTNNYLPISQAIDLYKNQSQKFLKVGCFVPVSDWNKVEEFYVTAFKEVLELLNP